MGRTGSGIEVRSKSIRFTFVPGKPTLLVNGVPAAPTPANVKWAHRLAAEIRERMRFGTFSMAEYFPLAGTAGAPTTVSMQLDSWLAGQRIEASTKASYSSAARFWKAAPADEDGRVLGDMALRAVKVGHLLHALATKRALSGKTINNYVDVLRGAFTLAVLDGLMPSNPVDHVPHAKRQLPPIDPFDAAEAEAIIADMYARYPAQVARYIETKFFTGLRTSESFGLRWPNVGLAAKEIVISEGVVRGIEKGSTKTNVVRTVFLNSRALAAIVAQKDATFLADGHVFHDPRYNERWGDERAFRRSYWAPTLKRLGIRYRPPYNTRHTYATMMLMAGMRPAFCAGQMGHSIEVFLRTYAKWIPGAGDQIEMAKLEAAIAPVTSLILPRK